MKDLYEILQVHPAAEPEVIRAAFHRLAEKYHPDRNGGPGATERMSELNAAWKVLSDPESRAWYDRQRTPPPPPSPSPPASSVPPVAATPVHPTAVAADASCARCGGTTTWLPNPAGCLRLIGVSAMAVVLGARVAFSAKEAGELAFVLSVVGLIWLVVVAHLVKRRIRTCTSCKATFEQSMF